MKFDDYKNKINSLFKDGYGWDNFSSCLLVIGLVLLLSKWTVVFGLFSIGYGIYRAASKNIYRRQLEAKAFSGVSSQVVNKFNSYKRTLIDLPKYKIFKCPNCSQKLRVPRGKGKIMISCKKCGKEFQGKS